MRRNEPARNRLEILGGAGFRRCLVIRLATSFISGAELLLLLVHHVAATIGPVLRLVPRLARPAPHILPALFGARFQYFPCFRPRTWGIQNSGQCSQSQARQEPYEAIAIPIRHRTS